MSGTLSADQRNTVHGSELRSELLVNESGRLVDAGHGNVKVCVGGHGSQRGNSNSLLGRLDEGRRLHILCKRGQRGHRGGHQHERSADIHTGAL